MECKKKNSAPIHSLNRCNRVVSAAYTNVLLLHFFVSQAVIYGMQPCVAAKIEQNFENKKVLATVRPYVPPQLPLL